MQVAIVEEVSCQRPISLSHPLAVNVLRIASISPSAAPKTAPVKSAAVN